KTERLRVELRQEPEERRVRPVHALVRAGAARARRSQRVVVREENRQRRRARRAGEREVILAAWRLVAADAAGAGARRDVRLQLGLRLPELLQEAVVGDVELIVVEPADTAAGRRPAVAAAR